MTELITFAPGANRMGGMVKANLLHLLLGIQLTRASRAGYAAMPA
jgi:hypothetical protein